jgi:hypothetical protein
LTINISQKVLIFPLKGEYILQFVLKMVKTHGIHLIFLNLPSPTIFQHLLSYLNLETIQR